MPSPVIELESVVKRYGSRTIIHGISFSVAKGEIVGFLGPNGAGKTTTMRMIAGATAASSGKVSVAGFDMATQNQEAARRIGYLPEHPPLYDSLQVDAYLRFVAKVKGVPRAGVARELDRVCTACRLQSVFYREVYKLSKGYRQRLGLAQALLGSPEVLLLDEPTSGLDPGQIQETREVIRSFGEQHAVLLSTHILPEVTMICQRVAIINNGRLLAVDSPQGLQRASEQTSSVLLHARAPAPHLQAELLGIAGVVGVSVKVSVNAGEGAGAGASGQASNESVPLVVECQVDDRDGVEAAIARAVATRWELLKLERRQPTLENVFMHYVSAAPAPDEVAA
jgi:ABC-2 type transport system ATP-binding protein